MHGAAAFLRWMLCEGSHQCALVIVKPFVAPLKQRTIARLQRLGCVVLTRICNTCQEVLAFVNFKVYDKIFWIDFRTFLMWSRTPPRECRLSCISETKETVRSQLFSFIKSKYNPEVAVTRGISPGDFEGLRSGPSFLKLSETEWPQFQGDDYNSHQERHHTLIEMTTATRHQKFGKRGCNRNYLGII